MLSQVAKAVSCPQQDIGPQQHRRCLQEKPGSTLMKWTPVSVENPTYDQSSLWRAGAALQILQRMTQRKPQRRWNWWLRGWELQCNNKKEGRGKGNPANSSAADMLFLLSQYAEQHEESGREKTWKYRADERNEWRNEMSFSSSFWRLGVFVNKNTIPYEIVFKVIIFINCMTLSDCFYTKLKLLILWKFQTNILYFRDVHVFTSVEFWRKLMWYNTLTE